MDRHVEDRLLDYLYGELEDGERGVVEAHLDGCPRCQAAYAELAGTRSLMASLGQEAPDRGTEFLVQAAERELRLRADRPVGALARFGAWIARHPVSTSLAVAGVAVVVVIGVGRPKLAQLEMKAAAEPSPEVQGAGTAPAPTDASASHRSLKSFGGAPTGAARFAGGATAGEGGGGTARALGAPAASPRAPAADKRRADRGRATRAQADLLDEEGENLQRGHVGAPPRRTYHPRLATIQVIRKGQGGAEVAPKKKAAGRARQKAAAKLRARDEVTRKAQAAVTGPAQPKTAARAGAKDAAPALDQGLGGLTGSAGEGAAQAAVRRRRVARVHRSEARRPESAPASAGAAAEDATADAERAPAHHRAHHRAPTRAATRAPAPPPPAAAVNRAAGAVRGRVAAKAPASAPPALRRAVALLEAGKAKAALPLLDDLLARPAPPWATRAYYERCRARAALGDRAGARADCRRAATGHGAGAAAARHLLLVLEQAP